MKAVRIIKPQIKWNILLCANDDSINNEVINFKISDLIEHIGAEVSDSE